MSRVISNQYFQTMNPVLPKRKHLPHAPPAWVPENSTFFITINCRRRSEKQLTEVSAANALLESVKFYQSIEKWWFHLFLLMPDHLHALMIFPREVSMREAIASWKSYHARRLKIVWQDGFFDHRIRNDAEFQEKAAYIRNNPVRAGFVKKAADWPHQLDAKQFQG